jgi:hypothetical protein
MLVPFVAVAMAGIAFAASANTGASLSDSQTGVITGQLASISITGTGVNGFDLSFANPLVPGTPQTVSKKFKNGGNANEDIYLVFNNNPALHALNQLGTEATLKITEDGTQVFSSGDLQDGLQTGGGGPFFGCSDAQCPLPSVVPLIANVAPGAVNTVTFTFGYTYQFTNSSNPNFNPYPVNALGLVDAGSVNSGLPYSLMALPVGAPAPNTGPPSVV